MKRIVALLLSLIMAFSFVACSSDTGTDAPADDAPAGDTESGDAPAGEVSEGGYDTTPITLSAFMNQVPNPPDWEWGQDPSSQKITELTGVTIEYTYATTTDNTELNTLLASGQDLPDFVVTPLTGTVRSTLVDQGFVLPLNQLADEHFPQFWDNLPLDMDKVYQEEDGNFYTIVSWYGDPSKYDDQILNTRGPVSITIKEEYLEEVGNPEMVTLDDYAAVITEISELHPEITHPIYDHYPNNPKSNSSFINLLARMYGATNSYFHWDGETPTSVFMQDYYKDALKQYNDFYQQGLINAERFAYKADQEKGTYQEMNFISHVGYYWNVIDGIGNTTDVIYKTIEFPMPEGRTSDQLKIHDDYYGLGSGGVFITKDTENPDRAIQYLDFLQSKEGQLIHRYGVEGVTWEEGEDGRPIDTQAKLDAQAAGEYTLQKDLGVYNYNFSWVTSNWILVYGATGTYANFPPMLPDFEVMTPHQQDERVSDLTYILTNPDEVILQDQINTLWAQGVAEMVTADSDDEFEQLYAEFIADMETAGVDTLDGYYQARAEHWKSVGLIA